MGGLAEATRRSPGPADFRIEWNPENQLTRVLKDSVEVASFKYDPMGRRIEKLAGGTLHSYVYDEAAILREAVAGSSTATFTYIHGPGIDEPLARENDSSAREYYHADGLGSISALTDQTGAVVEGFRYDAWGVREQGATAGGYAFTGREWDPETKLYYYRARYYEPSAGRFLSEDPIGFDGGINFYRYVAGNPANRRDPSGLRTTVVLVGTVVFETDSGALVTATHSALLIERDGESFLYDPFGDYGHFIGNAGSGATMDGEVANFDGYAEFYGERGEATGGWTFETTAQQEAEIRERIEMIGSRGWPLSGVPLGCAFNVSEAISGIGPFGDVKRSARPGALLRAIKGIPGAQAKYYIPKR